MQSVDIQFKITHFILSLVTINILFLTKCSPIKRKIYKRWIFFFYILYNTNTTMEIYLQSKFRRKTFYFLTDFVLRSRWNGKGGRGGEGAEPSIVLSFFAPACIHQICVSSSPRTRGTPFMLRLEKPSVLYPFMSTGVPHRTLLQQ